jgi:hypothetical protein
LLQVRIFPSELPFCAAAMAIGGAAFLARKK